jgi:hypothetical protein
MCYNKNGKGGSGLMRRQKYMNVNLKIVDSSNTFWCCREAAEWMAVETEISKSVNAAKVGISTVLTGKRETYKGFKIKADRL